MNNKTIPLQSIIDFCNKWGVEVKQFSFSELEIIFKNKKDSLGNKIFKSPFGMHGISWNVFNKTILITNEIKEKNTNSIVDLNKNINRIVLHELAHCLMNEKPDVINDFATSLYTLDCMFLRYKNIKHDQNELNTEFVVSLHGGFKISKTNNLKDYFNYFENELIKMDILTKNKKFTYNR